MAEPTDYMQKLAQLLQSPASFKTQYGEALYPFDDEEAILKQRLSMARALGAPSDRVHSTGQGGMFGALADALGGLGGALQQNAISDEQRALLERKSVAGVGRQALAQALEAAKDARERSQQIDTEGRANTEYDRRGPQRLKEAMAMAGVRRANEVADDTDRQVNDLSKRTEGATAVKQDLQTLIKATESDDIAGIGTFAGWLPNILTSEDGVKVRQAAKGVASSILKQRSGTAASEGEVNRLLEELGMSKGGSDDQFRVGLFRLVEQARGELKSKEAGARPAAVQEFRNRGGTTSSDLPTYAPGGGAAGPVKISGEAEYNALPSGADYIGPDGQLRTKR